MKAAWLLTTMITLATGGCVLESITPPTAQVERLELIEQTAEGARMDMVLTLTNPNRQAVPLRMSRYRVGIGDLGEFEFEDPLHLTLPAGTGRDGLGAGHTSLRLPIAIPTDGADLHGTPYRLQGSVSYEVPDEIPRLLVEANILHPRVEFSGSGSLP